MDYSDIIHLPHYELRYHRRMPIANRAAQFAPFAALTGYEARVDTEAQHNQALYDEQGNLNDNRIPPEELDLL